MIGRQMEIVYERADYVGCAIPWGQRIELELRLRFNESPRFELRRPLPGEQRLPGKKGRLAFGCSCDRIAECGDRTRERSELHPAPFYSFQRRSKAVHDPAQARIRRQ